MIKAVTFDFWNTLAYEQRGHLRGRRIAAWAGILDEAGVACERARLDLAFDAAWERYVERWTAGEQYDFTAAAGHILDDLGYDVPPDVRAALVEAFGRAGEGAELHLAEGVVECLATLRAAGVRIGIVCDVGMTPSHTLRDHLDRQGALGYFDHWSFSDEVGHYKPAPEIFRHALDGLRVAPGEAAHVGDLRRTDIAGAKAMGMVAVRYTGLHDDESVDSPEGDHVVSDHRTLPAVLGVGTGA